VSFVAETQRIQSILDSEWQAAAAQAATDAYSSPMLPPSLGPCTIEEALYPNGRPYRTPSEARAMSWWDGFVTFNRIGQIGQGIYESELAFLRSPYTLYQGVSNLVSDAYGYGKDALFGPERSLILGDELPYQAQSGIVRAIQQKGFVDATGEFVVGMLKSLPPISQIDAVNRNDYKALGASILPSLLFLEGGSMLRLGQAGETSSLFSLSASRTGQLTGIAELDMPFAQSAQAGGMLAALERRGVTVIDDVSRLPAGVSVQTFMENGALTMVYDSATSSFIDMLHDIRHVAQIQRVEASGLRTAEQIFASPRLMGVAERGAYEYELRLLDRHDGVSSGYVTYAQGQIESYYRPSWSTSFGWPGSTANRIFRTMEPGLKP
jgi:hypothetical protein